MARARQSAAPKLVLWDIDQTLIEVGVVTHRAYATAFQRVTGLPLTTPWQFDGRTELAAITQVLHDHNIDAIPATVDLFVTRLVQELYERRDELRRDGRVLPGATAALRACATSPWVHQSVLTGNLYRLAVLKTDLFGLAEHLDLRIGAYGGDAVDRRDLVRYAQQRAREHLGTRFTGKDTVVIGDTLLDIATAQLANARAVAVATGPYDAGQLRAAGADAVLADLTDTPAVMRAIFGDACSSW